MVSLEQVRLLESKVTKTIDYVKKVTEENTRLKEKLDSYQKRIDELEVLIQRFREDQSRIEDGILSALDRLNQFEDALENKISPETKSSTVKPDQDSSKKDIPNREEKRASGPFESPEAPREADSAHAEKGAGSTQKSGPGQGGELDIF
ncbi:MAG: cell division protein ZapB [Treponema sp.]|nr:cell division protein ZapB [Treponema sp.]